MNTQLPLNDFFSTSDLALAATISLFYTLESINRTNPQKAEFIFKRDASLDQLIESYWRKALQVEPQAFFTQLKFIKSRLYSH